ncbi:MAG: hypothetical protein VXY92_09080 [Planctomycetota bacterium]|nr:hypothetical protein [Planctomycetota bacterium]
MSLRSSRLSFLLAALTCLITALPSQGEGGEVQEQLQQARQKLAKKRAKSGELDDAGMEAELSRMSPEELLAARKRRGSRGQCRFVADVRPARLLPGQSGTMLITAILQGRSVLQAPASISVKSVTKGDLVEFGELTARPALAGTIHKGFLGRPVYENTAVFEVPVTLAGNATLGDKLQVAVDLEFDIYDGESTQVVGRFVERVQTDVEVGRALDPQVEPRAARSERDAPEEPVAPVGAGKVSAAGGAGSGSAVGGAASSVSAAPAAEDTPAASDTMSLPVGGGSAGGGWSIRGLLLAGGGILVVIVVLLLARKR